MSACSSFAVCWWLLAVAPFAIKPHPTPFRMANEATVVVEGTAALDGTVSVTRTWFAAPGVTVGATIVVPALAGASRRPFSFGPRQEPAIAPDTVVLFLVRGADGSFEPLLRIDGDNARGIVWFEGEKVFDYAQPINPGPYELVRAQHVDGAQPVATTPADVRAQVRDGLVARAKWAATLAIADADERARAVVGWIGSQSPDGSFWSERVWADLEPAIEALGPRAVPHVARVVATHAEPDAVATACRVLRKAGDAGRGAVPALIGRLRDLRGAEAIHLVRGLGLFADERSIPVLLDQLDAPDGCFVAEVAGVLQRAGATGFVDRIVARIPTAVDEAPSIDWLAGMLDAVHAVDPERARRLVRDRFADCGPLREKRPWIDRLLR